MAHLEEAIFCEGHKGDGGSGDEAASDGDERANEDKQGQQPNARDRQRPHASRRQRCVHQRYARLHRHPSLVSN